MIYFSIACVLCTIIFIFKYKAVFKLPYLTLTALLIGLLLSITYGVADYFTDQGIDESVIYHLRYGLDEAGFAEYALPIGLTVIALICLIVLVYCFIKVVKRRNKELSAKNKLAYFPIVLALLAVVFNPASENIYSIVSSELSSHNINNADYIKVTELITQQPLNLIYIYAESLEETYFDESLFPGLMPRLNKIREQAIVFKDIAQVTHTGWTIAGMVASQCGVPLFSASQGNAMSGMPQFLSGATCLGDVLSRNKYNLSYLGGASLDFAGKGNFYRTHGFSSIQGRAELTERLDDANYKSAWGLYDDSLFKFAQQELAILAKQHNPFAIFMLTLDTHHPSGHPSASCAQHQYADGMNEILNAVHCSDKLISEFVDYIQNNRFDKNTLIVIGSDHLAMRNTATNILNQGDRKNMLIMIPPSLKEGVVVDTPSSILDVSATILQLIGFQSDALGFGRNILKKDTPPLIAQHENFNDYLNSASILISSFWNYPQAVDDISFNDKNKTAYFGKEAISYPALFLIDDKYTTERIHFEFDSEKKLSEYLKTEKKGQKFLWIDQCNKINAIFTPVQESEYMQNCVAIGSLGSEKIFIKKIEEETKITKNDIFNELNKKSKAITQEGYARQVEILNKLTRYGADIEEYQVLPEGTRYQSIIIKSAAGINDGESFVTYSDGSVDLTLKGFTRGLNLVAFSNDKPPKIIHRIDTCQVTDDFKNDNNIVDILNVHNYDFYLLISQDSTICESGKRLENYMVGSALRLWPELSWRQAYVTILYKDGNFLEMLGENEQSIHIVLR